VFEAAIDCILLSFLHDSEVNDGKDKPYFMADSLKSSLGVSNKVRRRRGRAEGRGRGSGRETRTRTRRKGRREDGDEDEEYFTKCAVRLTNWQVSPTPDS